MLLPADKSPSSLLSLSDLQLILSPHASRFSRCIWPIWDRYKGTPEADRLTYDLTAEANVLNRYMVAAAKEQFAGVPGVRIDERNGFVLLVQGFPFGINGLAACRFKKLDGNGNSRNNLSTQRARAVRSNDNDSLDGMPPEATWVDVGHVLNGLRTGIREAQAIRVKDRKFIMNFPREEGGTITLTYPMLDGPAGSGEGSPRFEIVARREQDGTAGEGSSREDK